MIYGPNTAAVQSIIDRIPTLTEDEIKRLDAAWYAATDAARYAAIDAAMYAARDAAMYATRDAAMYAAWDAAWEATRDAATDATWYAARYAARYAAIDAAREATLATVTYDLATVDGPYTIAQRDLLLAPWVEVCGLPEGLVAALDGEA